MEEDNEMIMEEENFSSSLSSPITPLSLLSSPPHLLSDAENDDKKCAVCQDYCLSPSEEWQTCFYCQEFFKHSTKICADYVCQNAPSCTALAFNVRNCDFCRMEACFHIGMNDIISCDDTDVCLREQKKMGTSKFSAVKNDQEEKWVRALQSFNRYLTIFHEWLSLFPEYQRLSEDHRVILKERCRTRAVIVELIERSLYLHQVLKFDGFYWNPWNYSENDITILLANILSIILHLEDRRVTLESFNILKLKLVLKNNVHMRETGMDETFLQQLEEKVDEAESRLLNVLSRRGNVIEESATSYEDMFSKEPSPPDGNFPEHHIRLEL